jgi:quercetin dioxygenase-like cupin family protein
MKNAFITAIVAIIFLSCKNDKETPPPVSSIGQPQMIIPVSNDTLLSSGRKNIFLVSRRELPGLFVERSIFPPGYRSQPHTHPSNMNITVIAGSLNIAFTANPDSASIANVYGPGSFLVIPSGQSHFEWFTENTVMDITGIGPMHTINQPIVHSTKKIASKVE